MAIKILMPKISFIVTEGTIIEWLKKPGDPVVKGEPLLVIESEKSTLEVESPGAGRLSDQLAPPETTVPVTTTIGYILEPGETEAPPLNLDQPEAAAEASSPPPAKPEPPKKKKGPVRASPAARRKAREAGIELAEVSGSGPGGRIIEEDVAAYLAAQEASAPPPAVRATPVARKLAAERAVDLSEVQGSGSGGRVTRSDLERLSPASLPFEEVELNNIQRVAAERMALSFGAAPHFYLSVQVDMSQVVAMRQSLLASVEAKTGLRLSYTDIMLAAVGRALRQNLALNTAYEEGRLKRYRDINLGMAVDTPRGLVVAVIPQGDSLSLADLTRQRAGLVERAKNNRLTPEDMSGGTFTVSNLGMFGVDLFNAIINPPQAAILAVGQIAKRAVVVEDELAIRPTAWFTLSVDHRATDGATAARFLQDMRYYLTSPYQMLV